MGLADTFQEIVEALPDDWTDLTIDLRIFDEDRYVDAAVYLVQCNPQPYSHYDWHWKIMVSHRFGHSASAPTVHGTLKLLDDSGIDGEMRVRDARAGRVEVVQMWGRPESVRQEFRRIRGQQRPLELDPDGGPGNSPAVLCPARAPSSRCSKLSRLSPRAVWA